MKNVKYVYIVVYEIPCKSCETVYIGETGRNFGTRLNEHMKDCEHHEKKCYIRAERKQSQTEYNNRAITDHMNCTNHNKEREGLRISDKESDTRT